MGRFGAFSVRPPIIGSQPATGGFLDERRAEMNNFALIAQQQAAAAEELYLSKLTPAQKAQYLRNKRNQAFAAGQATGGPAYITSGEVSYGLDPNTLSANLVSEVEVASKADLIDDNIRRMFQAIEANLLSPDAQSSRAQNITAIMMPKIQELAAQATAAANKARQTRSPNDIAEAVHLDMSAYQAYTFWLSQALGTAEGGKPAKAGKAPKPVAQEKAEQEKVVEAKKEKIKAEVKQIAGTIDQMKQAGDITGALDYLKRQLADETSSIPSAVRGDLAKAISMAGPYSTEIKLIDSIANGFKEAGFIGYDMPQYVEFQPGGITNEQFKMYSKSEDALWGMFDKVVSYVMNRGGGVVDVGAVSSSTVDKAASKPPSDLQYTKQQIKDILFDINIASTNPEDIQGSINLLQLVMTPFNSSEDFSQSQRFQATKLLGSVITGLQDKASSSILNYANTGLLDLLGVGKPENLDNLKNIQIKNGNAILYLGDIAGAALIAGIKQIGAQAGNIALRKREETIKGGGWEGTVASMSSEKGIYDAAYNVAINMALNKIGLTTSGASVGSSMDTALKGLGALIAKKRKVRRGISIRKLNLRAARELFKPKNAKAFASQVADQVLAKEIKKSALKAKAATKKAVPAKRIVQRKAAVRLKGLGELQLVTNASESFIPLLIGVGIVYALTRRS
jgi:hypothetical protein